MPGVLFSTEGDGQNHDKIYENPFHQMVFSFQEKLLSDRR